MSGVRGRFAAMRSAFFAALAEGTSSPERLGVALGLGALVGSSPLLGLHSVLAIGLSFAFRLNKVLCFVGSNVSFGPMLAILVAAEVAIGSVLLGRAAPPLDREHVMEGARQGLLVWWLGWGVVGPALFAAGFFLGWGMARRLGRGRLRPEE